MSREPYQRINKFMYIAGLTSLIVGALYLLVLQLDIYVLSGIVSGRISLTTYTIKYFDRPIDIPSLNSVRLYSLLIYIQSTTMILFGIYALIWGHKAPKNINISIQLNLGTAISNIIITPLIHSLYPDKFIVHYCDSYAITPLIHSLYRVIQHENELLKIDIISTTSAGYLYLGRTYVYLGPGHILVSNFLYLTIIMTTYLLVELLVYYKYVRMKQTIQKVNF